MATTTSSPHRPLAFCDAMRCGNLRRCRVEPSFEGLTADVASSTGELRAVRAGVAKRKQNAFLPEWPCFESQTDNLRLRNSLHYCAQGLCECIRFDFRIMIPRGIAREERKRKCQISKQEGSHEISLRVVVEGKQTESETGKQLTRFRPERIRQRNHYRLHSCPEHVQTPTEGLSELNEFS